MVTSNNTGALLILILELSRLFAMKDLGPLHYFLCIEAHASHRGHFDMSLTQTKHVLDVLHKTNMKYAKPIKSPVQLGLKLSRYDGDPVSNA